VIGEPLPTAATPRKTGPFVGGVDLARLTPAAPNDNYRHVRNDKTRLTTAVLRRSVSGRFRRHARNAVFRLRWIANIAKSRRVDA